MGPLNPNPYTRQNKSKCFQSHLRHPKHNSKFSSHAQHANVTCFLCNKQGHIKRNCPKLKQSQKANHVTTNSNSTPNHQNSISQDYDSQSIGNATPTHYSNSACIINPNCYHKFSPQTPIPITTYINQAPNSTFHFANSTITTTTPPADLDNDDDPSPFPMHFDPFQISTITLTDDDNTIFPTPHTTIPPFSPVTIPPNQDHQKQLQEQLDQIIEQKQFLADTLCHLERDLYHSLNELRRLFSELHRHYNALDSLHDKIYAFGRMWIQIKNDHNKITKQLKGLLSMDYFGDPSFHCSRSFDLTYGNCSLQLKEGAIFLKSFFTKLDLIEKILHHKLTKILDRNEWRKTDKTYRTKAPSKPETAAAASYLTANNDAFQNHSLSHTDLLTQKALGSPHNIANWLPDSGASCHMTPLVNDLFQVEKLPTPIFVQLADGHIVKCEFRGNITLTLHMCPGCPWTFSQIIFISHFCC